MKIKIEKIKKEMLNARIRSDLKLAFKKECKKQGYKMTDVLEELIKKFVNN